MDVVFIFVSFNLATHLIRRRPNLGCQQQLIHVGVPIKVDGVKLLFGVKYKKGGGTR